MAESPYPSLGSIIRQQRELASLSMRAVADAVGISNPYLSQIERDLRAPSDAVLTSIAESLHTTADELYRQAGYVPDPDPDAEPSEEGGGLAEAIEGASELSAAQRRALGEVYRSMVDANRVRRRRA